MTNSTTPESDRDSTTDDPFEDDGVTRLLDAAWNDLDST